MKKKMLYILHHNQKEIVENTKKKYEDGGKIYGGRGRIYRTSIITLFKTFSIIYF